MFLSIATIHQPATDLGYLLHKHPGRLHEIEQAFGKAWVFYPDASRTRCEAALVLDIVPLDWFGAGAKPRACSISM
jgi:hypothetical protein